MKVFRAFVEQYESIPEADWLEIKASFRRREVPANTPVLQEGKVCRHLYFLESGLLRFYIQRDGEEVIKFFTVAPYFFTSQASFNAQTPSKETIETIESSVIWETTYEENEKLFDLPSWNRFGRKIRQEVQFKTEEILEKLQTQTAESRYFEMLNDQPKLIQRLPLKFLASYLGVAPQSLSRIRKKIKQNNRT